MESLQSSAMLCTEGEHMNNEEREKYLLAARLPAFRRKVDRSLLLIQEALTYPGKWMISYSSGKDSTVLLDLLVSAGWKGMGFHCICSDYEDPPENQTQTERARQMYGVDIRDIYCYGEYDAWREAGHFFCDPVTETEKKVARRANTEFKKVSSQFMRENGISNMFMGLTKEESRVRSITLSARGSLYYSKGRNGWTCCPLANWTATDIWAYIVSRGLPYLSVYDTPNFSREKIRNELTVMYCPSIVAHGELLQYRLAYPELFARLQKEFPNVKRYAY
jgi:3'-phosphoadenosine 5'-phosphosulfate sulfotransferase (PAPS reductase)/FAD synthetase